MVILRSQLEPSKTLPTPPAIDDLEPLPITPGDLQLFVCPAGDGEHGDGTLWRVTVLHGPTVVSGRVEYSNRLKESAKSRIQFIRHVAEKLGEDPDSLIWWLERDIRGSIENYLFKDAAEATAQGKPAEVVFRTVEPGTRVKARDRGNIGSIIEDLGEKCLVRFISPEGDTAEKTLPKSELKLLNGTPLASGGSDVADFPPILTFRELSARYPDLQPEVIHGVARRGEVVNVTSTTKAGKSMLTGDLAHASVAGAKWLHSFDVEPGPVLILDNELDPRTLRHRLWLIAEARSIPMESYQDKLQTVSFRGRVTDIFQLQPFFDGLEPGRFSIVVLDALYRFLGDRVDENSNSDMSRIYNQLVAYATRLECVLVVIHHASKGSQSGKSATDVGSGAGAQSRAADTHLILRPHAEDGAVVLEAVCRSFPPVEPRVLRWAWPCWELATDLDPTALKPDKQTRDKPSKDRQQIDDCRGAIEKALLSHLDHREVVSKIKERSGRKGKYFDLAFGELIREGQLRECQITRDNGQKYGGYEWVFSPSLGNSAI